MPAVPGRGEHDPAWRCALRALSATASAGLRRMSGLDSLHGDRLHRARHEELMAVLGQAHAQWLAQLPPELLGGAPSAGDRIRVRPPNAACLVQLSACTSWASTSCRCARATNTRWRIFQAQLARHDGRLRSRGIVALRGGGVRPDGLRPGAARLGGRQRHRQPIRYARSQLPIVAREEDGELLLTSMTTAPATRRPCWNTRRLRAGPQPEQRQHRPGLVLRRAHRRVASAPDRAAGASSCNGGPLRGGSSVSTCPERMGR